MVQMKIQVIIKTSIKAKPCGTRPHGFVNWIFFELY